MFLLGQRKMDMADELEYWHTPHLRDLIKEKVVDLNQEDELVIDPDFKKALASSIKNFNKNG